MQRYESYHQHAAKHRPAFAILRVDTSVRKDTPFQRRVTVKKVVLSEDYANAEVERLNTMKASKGCQYIAQLTELDESDHSYRTGVSRDDQHNEDDGTPVPSTRR